MGVTPESRRVWKDASLSESQIGVILDFCELNKTMILSLLPTIVSLAFLMVIMGTSTLVMEARKQRKPGMNGAEKGRRKREKVANSGGENSCESESGDLVCYEEDSQA